MFGGDERVEAGGGIWVRGDASDEVWYERIAEFSVAADDVVEDFFSLGFLESMGVAGMGRERSKPLTEAQRSLTGVWRSVAECGGPR